MKSPRVRMLGIAAILMFLAAVAFVIYGLRTDCVHTSGYVNCSETDDKP